MNKVVTSAGLLALGAATLYGYDPELTRAKTGRPFSVSATVRGFYDDNPTFTPDKSPIGPKESFGYEVSPAVHVNLPLEQTFLRAGYVYSLRYYEERDPHKTDQSHEFNALLRHAFSPRHDIAVADSFVITEEPTVVERFGIVTAPTRTEGDALRNRGSIDYNVGLTPTLGLSLGYVNNLYDYSQDGAGSRSALLDRLEHLIRADLRYQVNPTLVGLLGYQFGLNSYTGDEFIYSDVARPLIEAELAAAGVPNATALSQAESDIRDSYSHYFYLGADHDFSNRLRGSVRGGVQYTDYHETDESDVSPYADVSLSYMYRFDSSVQAGIKHARAATDIVAPDGRGRPTLDQETTAGYVQLIHRILPDLTGTLFGQAQYGTFTSGDEDDVSEALYMVGINFEYRINRHFAVETGYTFDLLDSDVDNSSRTRDYDRSRVYIGARATY